MPLTNKLDLKFDKRLTEWRDRGEPGCAIGILDAGNLVFAAGYGIEDQTTHEPIGQNTRFDIASEAKQFTAACILLLERDRHISLDLEVGQYLPELPARFRHVTVRQLLHHISGIPDFYKPMAAAGMIERDCTLSTVYQYICELPALDFQSGARFSYSNSGYALLAVLVERVSGMSFAEFIAARIFQPLKMTDSLVHDLPGRSISRHAKGHIHQPRSGYQECWLPGYAVPGPGCLYSSVQDLARWLSALYGNALGGPKLIDRMLQGGRLNDESVTKYGMGLDWGQCFTPPSHLRIITHSGGHAGYRAIMAHLPDHAWSIILLCNNRRIDHGMLALQLAEQLSARRRRLHR